MTTTPAHSWTPPPSDEPNWRRAVRDAYETYWRDSEEGLFVVRVLGPRHFVYMDINPALEVSLGFTKAEIAGRRPSECLSSRSAASVTARYQACVEAGRPIHYHEVLTFPAGRKLCENTLVPLVGETGEIELLLGSCRDAEKPRAADDSGRFPSLLLSTLDSIETHVAILDLRGRIQLVNAAWRRFGADRGARHDAYVGDSYLDVCAQGAAEGDPSAVAVLDGLSAVLTGQRDGFSLHYRCERQVFLLRAVRIDQVGVPWILVTHDDVTAVSDARDELSRLTERLLDVQEEERRRIAVELHDSTSQHLVALQLGLMAVRSGRATEETLEDMRSELIEAQKEIRTLSYLLHPPTLAREGLTQTLQGFADGFAKRTGMTIDLKTDGALDGLPFSIQRSLFRVVQEALSNAHRHGQARHVGVDLAEEAEGVRLLVADDGRRSGGEASVLRPGVGVPGMDARIRRFQGGFSIEHTPEGARVRAFIPAGGVRAEAAKADEDAAAEP